MKKTSSLIHLMLGLVLLAAFAAEAPAQTQGEITGVITDSSGAVVPDTAVTVTNVATGATRRVITNEAGVYNFPALPPGVYTVRVEKSGFKAITRPEVKLEVQQVARLDFNLEVGEVSQTVTVEGHAPLLSSESTTVGTVIENKRIVDLPLNGRNFLQLVATAPNVSFGFTSAGQANSRQGGTRANQNISVAGQRSYYNRFTIDGVENTDVNFNTPIFLPSIDALQEFKVQTGVYPAEFGRASTQINISTKSGAREFHGAAFEFLRNDVLDARIYDFSGKAAKTAAKAPLRWNQYGFVLSGPIWLPKKFFGPIGFDNRERIFFMTNFEGFRERRTGLGRYNLPPVSFRGGDFSPLLNPAFTGDKCSGQALRIVDAANSRCNPAQALVLDALNREIIIGSIYDPATLRTVSGGKLVADPFPGNKFAPNRIHPTALKLLEFYPSPNLFPNALGPSGFNHEQPQGSLTDKDQFVVRGDFIESTASSWAGRYSWGDEEQLTPGLKLNGTKLLTNVKQVMASNTRTLSANKVNEARFGYNQFFNSLGRELANTRDVVGELKIPGIESGPPIAWGIPAIGIAGFAGFGDDSEGPYVNNNRTYQIVDNFSWTLGSHAVRFGGELRWDQYNQVGNQFARGSLIFEPNATSSVGAFGTGHAFADYLLGYCKRCEVSVSLAQAQFRAFSKYFYVDDSWKVTPKLTLNFGLRYEYTPPWLDQTGRLVNIYVPFADSTPNVADRSRHPVFVRIGSGDFYEGLALRFNPAIQVARDGRLGERLVADDKNDFAPRFGLAWSPTSKWTVRTGAGVFYAQDTGNPRFDMARNLAGRRRDEATPDLIDLTFDQPFRNLGGTVQINNPYVLGNIFGRRTPYVIQYLLNVQRQIGNNLVLELGYLGSVGRKLESLRAFNEAIPGATGSTTARSPYPEFGRIQEVDGSGKSSYNGFSAKLEKRFSAGLSFLNGYTWSKSIDTASAIRSHDSDTLFPQNSYNLAAEKALSSFHVAHRFVNSLTYELPLGRGRRLLDRGGVADAVLGGWQVSSIFTLQTGFPLTIMVGRDQANTGGGFDRPIVVAGQSMNLDRGVRNADRWFNTAAFSLPPLGSFGNAGRNTVITPGLVQWDASLLKNFRFTERKSLQFRFEAFNAPNHPNLGNPNRSFVSSSFGKITGTRTNMRELQFGLKLLF